MRKTQSSDDGILKVNVISGTYVVLLAFDLPEDKCSGLRGFSIHREDHTENESYFLEGMKAFAETDPGFPAGAMYSTKEHPIQGFQWADYSAKPGHAYTYTVAALKGTPKHLKEFTKVAVSIETESPENGTHDIYFNRGTAASQEYVRRFGNKRPEEVPNGAAFEWLSRGLYEAMKAFVKSCKPGMHALRIAAYEFNYDGILEVIKDTIDKGVDIQIVYDARKENPRKLNVAKIKAHGLTSHCKPRSEGKSYISHNKFMVKLDHHGKALSVWTGGTNFSEGGIFGHSNVAHVIEDPEVADTFFQYWKALHTDPRTEKLRTENEALTPLPDLPVSTGTTSVFSPRQSLDALELYAKLASGAKSGLFMTFAFGMNDIFKDVYRNSQAPFRLALLEKKTRPLEEGSEEREKEEEAIQDLRDMPENVFAIGDFIKTNEFDGWVKEKLSGLNSNVKYVHNKFMLVDPLSSDPIVVAGSANFSNASTTDNDENMVIIRGNTRVADIYLGEFMRLFSHHSFRESLQWRKPNEPPKPLDTGDTWWKDNFGDNPRSARRAFFAQAIEEVVAE